jgi:hypothetical protein
MRTLRLSGGVYRTTTARRFEKLDAFFQPVLESRFSRQTPLLVEDWAASACITSAEWFTSLVQIFPALKMVASDLHLYLVEVILPTGDSFVVEAEGHPLQYLKPPFVIPLHRRETAKLPVNRWLQARAHTCFAELKSRGMFEFFRLEEGPEEWTRPPIRFRRIPLTHPAAVALSCASPEFQVESHSVFEPRELESCDVIRSMNIFNRSYFDEPRLLQGLGSCWASLKTGGLLLVGRTVEEGKGAPAIHHASVLQKTSTGFSVLDRCNAPSEVEDLAIGFRP